MRIQLGLTQSIIKEEHKVELAEFLKIVKKAPRERALVIWVRNFNDPEGISSIDIDKVGEERSITGTCVSRFSLRDVLPKGAWQILVRNKNDKGVILVKEFKHKDGIGQQIADLYNRPVTIVHMFGGGRQWEADQNYYHFQPKA